MDHDSLQIELPLEDRFKLRKIEINIQELSREDLEREYLQIVWQQMMERKALGTVLKNYNINIIFDSPSDDTEKELEQICQGDNDEPFDFNYIS